MDGPIPHYMGVNVLQRYTMPEFLDMMHPDQRDIARRIVEEHGLLFLQAPGSSHNHQAWQGGYWDHILEVMNWAVHLYGLYEQTGRLACLEERDQFTLADALIVLFLHDIEKPFCYQLQKGRPVANERGRLLAKPEYESKAARIELARRKIAEFGIMLTPKQSHGLRYVEGLRDREYSPHDRVMRPIAAFCHMCDLSSARIFYGFPLEQDDPWQGSVRGALRV